MPNHRYYAEATALKGELLLPLKQKITPQLSVVLPETGGYRNQQSCGYRVESVVSFASAYTQVAGNPEVKEDRGLNTLVTAVVEGFNVLDVVTADRIVAQISTEHPKDGYTYIPRINLLGTRFENLRIAGRKINPKLNLDLFEKKPDNDEPYTKSSHFVHSVLAQHGEIRARHTGYKNQIEGLLGRFHLVRENFEKDFGDEAVVECSVVDSVTVEDFDPEHCFGHVIRVPHFGTIYLGSLKLTHSKVEAGDGVVTKTLLELTMIDIEMGCTGHGTVSAAVAKTNGMPGKG
jgi:hypothetical protein